MYNLTKSYSISVGWISTTFMLIFIQGMIILNLYLYFLVLDWPAQLSDVLPLHTASCYSSCLSHHWKICTRNLFYFPTYLKFNIIQNIVMAKHDQMNLHFFPYKYLHEHVLEFYIQRFYINVLSGQFTRISYC